MWYDATNAEHHSTQEGHMQIILFNKPCNVLCQFTEPGKRLTLADYIPLPGFFTAGRLDFDTEGLLVLTNSGRIQRRIVDPASKLLKTYLVQVEGIPEPTAIQNLLNGVHLDDSVALPTQVTLVKRPSVWKQDSGHHQPRTTSSWLTITLSEDRNGLIKKMTAAAGLPAMRLIRQAVGPWHLHKLQPGEWKVTTVPDDWL